MPVHCSSWTRARLHAQGWAWSAAWLQWDRSLAASCSVCAKHGTDAQLTLKGTVYRSGRAIAESVSVTPRLHLNFSPCLSALYLLQLSCKSSGWCPPLVPLGRFSTSKYSHTGLRFNCFMLVCFFLPLHVSTDACAVSEPFGVGVVASRALVQAGETLNQHFISSPEYSLAKEQVSIHWKSFNLVE